MEVKGRIKLINPRQDVSTSFSKREFVITTDEQYPQHIQMEFNQDKCDLLDKYTIGQAVVVSINLRGREWVNPQGETKYFNTIQAWRIDAAEGQQPAASNQSAPPPASGTPAKEYVHTGAFNLQEALTKNWTYESLVAGGHGHWKENAAPGAPSAPAAKAYDPTMPLAAPDHDDFPF